MSSCLALKVLEVSGSSVALHCAPVQNRALLGRLLGAGGSSRRPDGAVEKASHLKHFVDRLPETVEVIVDQTWTGSRTRVTSCWASRFLSFFYRKQEDISSYRGQKTGKVQGGRRGGNKEGLKSRTRFSISHFRLQILRRVGASE